MAVEGFRLFRRDRSTGRQGGGVCFYVHHTCNVKRFCHLEHPALEMLWLEITIGKEKMKIGCLYWPTSSSTEFWSTLEKASAEVQGQSIILLGDLNVNSMDKTDSQYNHLLSLCLSHQLNELVQSSTRITGNSAKCLDLLLSNMSNLQTPTVTHIDYTDHSLVSSTVQFVGKEMPTTGSVIHTRRRWETDNSQLSVALQKHMGFLVATGLNNKWIEWRKKFTAALDEVATKSAPL